LHISQQPPHTPETPPEREAGGTRSLLARCSQPLSTNQTPHTPPPKMERQQPTPTRGRNHSRFPRTQGKEAAGLLSQSPIVCLMINFSPAGAKTSP